ncbi:hypothetical protein TNCV_4778121 [Trichonephila clavipes]|nr:hypothetical protein TNCV_4778121 [Trichonephila clavipes]
MFCNTVYKFREKVEDILMSHNRMGKHRRKRMSNEIDINTWLESREDPRSEQPITKLSKLLVTHPGGCKFRGCSRHLTVVQDYEVCHQKALV